MNRFDYQIKILPVFAKSQWKIIFKYVSLHKDIKILLEKGQAMDRIKTFVDNNDFNFHVDLDDIRIMIAALKYPTTDKKEQELKSMTIFELHIMYSSLKTEYKRITDE